MFQAFPKKLVRLMRNMKGKIIAIVTAHELISTAWKLVADTDYAGHTGSYNKIYRKKTSRICGSIGTFAMMRLRPPGSVSDHIPYAEGATKQH